MLVEVEVLLPVIAVHCHRSFSHRPLLGLKQQGRHRITSVGAQFESSTLKETPIT